jgi:hypothetical protein
VDFEKAFDMVWRDGLWCILLLNNINGKMYKVIYNMYQNIKSRKMGVTFPVNQLSGIIPESNIQLNNFK